MSDGNEKIIFYWYYSTDSSLNITSAAGKFSLNKWHHIVAQRTSGDIYLFVDGELIGVILVQVQLLNSTIIQQQWLLLEI